MTLTPEQIDRLIQQADGLAPKEGSIFRALVKLTEAEVRKQDNALIRQLVEALTTLRTTGAHEGFAHDTATTAIAAGRARLKGKT